MSQQEDPSVQPDTPSTTPDTSIDESKTPDRRQFVAGIATALGVGALIGAGQLTGEPERSAEVRSRIVSRIQDELKRSKSELLNNYDKPDMGGTHGRYNKPN